MIYKILPKRIWLVNRDFQLRYTGAGLAAGLISTALTLALILYPLYAFKILTVGMFLPLPIIISMIVAALLNCVLQIFFGIVLTHRIAGPIFSITKHLRLVALGKWRISMKLRRGDELQPIVRHLNEMSVGLITIAESDIRSLNEIKQSIFQYEGQTHEREFLIASLDRLVEEIKKRITDKKEPSNDRTPIG
jgi:hypothetical protein